MLSKLPFGIRDCDIDVEVGIENLIQILGQLINDIRHRLTSTILAPMTRRSGIFS